MGQQEYNTIKEIARRQQKIEKRILQLQKELEVAILTDEPNEVFDTITYSIQNLKSRQEQTFAFNYF